MLKNLIPFLISLLITGPLAAQEIDTFMLHYARSRGDTIIYTRIIRYDNTGKLYHVRDYYVSGQIQMDAYYSSFDKRIKEEYSCNYHSNTKTGSFREWYGNGQPEFCGTFKNGARHGLCTSWYENGVKEAEEHWHNGQLHGRVKYWSAGGSLLYDLTFDHGLNKHPPIAVYKYLAYTPADYHKDTLKRWPLIIYLHGGSDRGTDLNKLYSQGIPGSLLPSHQWPVLQVI